MSGTLGTSSTASVCRPAISAPRNAEPIPNATTSAFRAAGRAISGRTGISLASTVSRVMDVPATQSCGVAPTWPAWTDAISSSRDAKVSPPTDAMNATLGWTSTPGRTALTTIAIATATPATEMSRARPPGDQPPRQDDPERRVARRQAGQQQRRSQQRDQEERARPGCR